MRRRQTPAFNDSRIALHGFTVMEMIVAFGIVILLMAIAVPVFVRARQQSKMLECVSHVRSLAQGFGMYRELQTGALPPMASVLSDVLSGQIDNPETFQCPDDLTDAADSYSDYYVPRKRESPESYLLGCARHVDNSKAVELLLDGTVINGSTGEVKLKLSGSHSVIHAFTQISSGTIELADGSQIEAANGIKVDLLQSLSLEQNHYHVFRIPIGTYGKLIVTVAQGARLDIATPSANIRVQGGEFTVTTGLTPVDGANHNYSLVEVTTGQAHVTPIVKGRIMELVAGKRRTFIGAAN